MNRFVPISFMLALSVLIGTFAFAAQTVLFEPVRAPSKGPADAPVTIIEIADYM